MLGVLVIAHGSRAKETEATLEAVLSIVREKLPGTPVECAFMEFSERTVGKGVAALAKAGVTRIKAVPYFLFTGVHLKEDIPRLLEECAASFPDVGITMGAPLGDDARLAEILLDRIKD